MEDELAEKDVEDEDEEDDGAPEDGREPAQLVPVLVQCQHVVLVGGGWKKNKKKRSI